MVGATAREETEINHADRQQRPREHNEATSDGWDKFKFFAQMGVDIGFKIAENYLQRNLGMEQVDHDRPVPDGLIHRC